MLNSLLRKFDVYRTRLLMRWHRRRALRLFMGIHGSIFGAFRYSPLCGERLTYEVLVFGTAPFNSQTGVPMMWDFKVGVKGESGTLYDYSYNIDRRLVMYKDRFGSSTEYKPLKFPG